MAHKTKLWEVELAVFLKIPSARKWGPTKEEIHAVLKDMLEDRTLGYERFSFQNSEPCKGKIKK